MGGVIFPGGADDGFLGNILAQVNDLKAVIFKHESHQILADVMDIAFHRGYDHNRHLLPRASCRKQGLENAD